MSTKRNFLGTGIAFPLRVNPNGGITMASEEQLVQQSIWLILATGKGELKGNPKFGCGIHDYVFTNNTPAQQAQIAHQVQDALQRWERRIDVIDIRVSDGEALNQLLISVEYRLRSTHAFGNLVYPFYLLDEGGAGNAT